MEVATEVAQSWAASSPINPGPYQFHPDPACARAWMRARGYLFCRRSAVRELMRPIVVPGDEGVSAMLDFARTVVRRAERRAVGSVAALTTMGSGYNSGFALGRRRRPRAGWRGCPRQVHRHARALVFAHASQSCCLRQHGGGCIAG